MLMAQHEYQMPDPRLRNPMEVVARRAPARLRHQFSMGSENERVNNMNESEFAEHMNELFMRDNQKPISVNLLA